MKNTELIDKISYEIRSSLNVISGYISLAKMNIDNKEKVEDCLDKAEEATAGLLSVLSEVLGTSKGVPATPARPLRILVVDDNAVNRIIARKLLEDRGYLIDEEENGTDAINRITETDPYDIILMDVHMPGIDGYETTKRIRAMADSKKAGIPIIAVSGDVYEEDIERSLKAGMNAHIPKPISIDTLLSVIKEQI
ncbi:MAG: response regulator [Lachnospiraceae bacterium]|nr:response regulator [Lachnospiraceae bacterium]